METMLGVQLKTGVLAEHQECLHQAVHERLGELLRVLKVIISKHQRLNSVDILSTAGTVIATVKGEPAGPGLLRVHVAHSWVTPPPPLCSAFCLCPNSSLGWTFLSVGHETLPHPRSFPRNVLG